jgi:hypothetical protein
MEKKKRLVIVNGFSPSMLNNRSFVVRFKRINNVEEVRNIQAQEIINFVRHPATVQVLSQILGQQLVPSNATYTYQEGDTIILVTLGTPQRGQEVTAIKLEDLVIYEVSVVELE